MTSYVNGYNKPSFLIQKEDGTYIEEIELPITNESGLIEDYIPEEVTIKLLNKRYVQKFLGWRLVLTLNYDRYVTADTLIKIRTIIDYIKGVSQYGTGVRVTIKPRIDNPARQFRVIYTGESLNLGIHKGGSKAPGMRMPVLKFESILIYKQLPISNMDEVAIIPTDFIII